MRGIALLALGAGVWIALASCGKPSPAGTGDGSPDADGPGQRFTLELRAIDASTGAAVEDFELWAYASDPEAATADPKVGATGGELLAAGTHPGGRVTLEVLAAWPAALAIEAPGYRSWRIDLDAAAPDGRAAVTARMDLMARLVVESDVAGVVVDVGGNPLADVDVGLFESGISQWEGDARFLTEEEHWRIWPAPYLGFEEFRLTNVQKRSRKDLFVTRTDTMGRFRFTGVPRGVVCVRAWLSPTIEAFVDGVSIAGDAVPELRLVLPPGHHVLGAIEVPEGVSSRLRMVAGQQLGERVPRALPAVATIAEDGTFRLGPFEAGEVALFANEAGKWQPVGLLPKHLGSDEAGCPIPLGRVVVPPDRDVDASFDLGRDFPGSARLRVLVDGAPSEDIEVFLCEAGDHGFLHSTFADREGVVNLEAVPPGAMEVWVKCTDKVPHWITRASRELLVESGRVAEWQVDITRVQGVVSCVDAETGQPLAEGKKILVTQVEPDCITRMIVRTGKGGQLNWRRPAGTFWLSHAMAKQYIGEGLESFEESSDLGPGANAAGGLPQEVVGQVIVEWPAVGPASVTVRL